MKMNRFTFSYTKAIRIVKKSGYITTLIRVIKLWYMPPAPI